MYLSSLPLTDTLNVSKQACSSTTINFLAFSSTLTALTGVVGEGIDRFFLKLPDGFVMADMVYLSKIGGCGLQVMTREVLLSLA
jgi:hypothetical protein